MSRRWLRGLCAAATAILLSACQASFFATVNGVRSDSGSERVAGQVFDRDSGLRLDVYQPEQTSADAPIVVFYYGGSWRSGKRGWYRFVGRALAAQGIVTVIPDYRKFPDVSFAELMTDAANALRWVQANREELGSSGPLFVSGHSAGAHVAALLATDERYLRRVRVQPEVIAGLIGFAGPYNFLPIVDPKVAEVFVDDAGAYDAQPINHVDSMSAPALLFHGADDETVRPFNSKTYAAALSKAGVAAEYRQVAGLSHVRLIFEVGSGSAVDTDISQRIAQFVAANSKPTLGHADSRSPGSTSDD